MLDRSPGAAAKVGSGLGTRSRPYRIEPVSMGVARRPTRIEALPMGQVVGEHDLDKALALAARLEDDEIVRRLQRHS